MVLVDSGDEGIFYGDEGCRMEVIGKFAFGGVIEENAVGLAWMGTC